MIRRSGFVLPRPTIYLIPWFRALLRWLCRRLTQRQGVVLPFEQPQLRFSIGGNPIPGVVALEIELDSYFAANRFRIDLAIGAAPFASKSYFASLGMETVTIEAAFGGFGYVSIMTGQIDNICVDFLKNIVLLTGRDLSAQLIDTEITETFSNQTASQIANAIAERHQLTPNVTATATPVGQYYELDYARSGLGLYSRMTTEWNLLCALAKGENFCLSVSGTTLNFGPQPASTPVPVTANNFLSLSIDIATALPGRATVKSWSSRNKSVVSETDGTGVGTTIIYPNLNAVQAQNFAANHLATLGRHGTILSGSMPADLTLAPGVKLQLSGTNSPFDQVYTVSEVSRSMHARSGFIQTVRAYAAADF